ncbi:MAG: DUF4390 domain-containing protein [Burkholderiales bacterium]|nr:DUF4390 domain-containing protein [Burkholderiales bacterium]
MTVSSTLLSTRPRALLPGDPCHPTLWRWSLLFVALIATAAVQAADPPLQVVPQGAAVAVAPAAGLGGTVAPQLRREDGQWELGADLDLQLSPSLESALQRGLPLYFTLRLLVTRPRWYWLDAEVIDLQRDYRVSYHALTRQYRVAVGGIALSYPNLAEALRAVSSVRGWPVAEAARLRPSERYRARLELRLDGSRLPKPLQITAIGPGDWSSEVSVEWEFAP